MAGDADPVSQIAFVARSDARVQVLEELLESGPATQRDLRDCLDTSRSTVTRALQALAEEDWIESSGDAYRLTPVGTVIAAEFLDLVDTVRMTEELSSFLRWFPIAENDLELAALTDAEVTTRSDSDPYAPARKHLGILETATSLRSLLPSIDIEGAKLVHDRILGGEFESEMVVSPSVAETIETGEFAPLFREQIESGGLTVHVADGELPFYLGIAYDGRVQIGVEDDEGFPRALLETTDETVWEWADGVYQEMQNSARIKPAAEF
ncbi:helix-turn-helix transcriptional regulator [Halobacteriales archaeon Cl-PHB]